MSWFSLSSRRLRVGVTGHRLNRLPEAARPALRAQIGATLSAISEAARAAGHGHARLTLLTALAEGADRYAADSALALGWRLEAPLPFPPRRYEEDFPEESSKAEFRALMRTARRVHVAHDGVIGDGEDNATPYAAVGDALVEGAQLMLTVWNGEPPAGVGGTAEVCARALSAGAPVIWVAPDASVPPRLILPEGQAPKPRSFRQRLFVALAERFANIPRPQEMRAAPR